MSEIRQHHCYSPSKLASLEACPKFSGLRTTNLAALTGTLQHSVAETGIDNPELDDAKISAVAECLTFVDERKRLYPGGKTFQEIYVPIDDEEIIASDGQKFIGTTAGYLDICILSADGKTVELIDMKYGKVAVKAKDNPQMMAYVLGLAKKFPDIEKVFVWILSPHRDEIDGCEYTSAQFGSMRLRIKTIVGRAVEANKNPEDFSMARANQGACMWCANLGRCPKVAEIALNIGKRYAPLEIPQSICTSVFSNETQVAMGLKLAAIIKMWTEAYRTQATAKSIESDFVPDGYKLVSTVKRSVVNAKKFAELVKTFLPPSDRAKVDELLEIPIGKCEKLVSVAAPRGKKESTVADLSLTALAEGVVIEGAPFAFLRQDNSKET